MIQKQFFKGLSWLIFLNLLIKPLWIFAIDRQVQNCIGNETYGVYFALFNLSYVLLFVADAGLTNMMTQRIAGKFIINSRQLLHLKLALLTAYCMVCLLATWLTHISEWALFIKIILLQILGSLFLFLRTLLTANQYFKTDALFSVADKTLLILLAAIFIYGWWQPITITIFLELQIICTAIATIILSIFLWRRDIIKRGPNEKLSLIFKWLIPFAAIILLMATHYRLDGFLLERLRPDGAKQAGIYATAYRLLDAANMIGYLTASFLVPFIARNKEDKNLIRAVVNRSQQGLLFLAISISCFAAVFPLWIQESLYHTNASQNNTVIQLCLAVLPAYYLVHVHGSVLTAMGSFRSFILILITSVLINTALNFWLIPKEGAAGCCIAAIVSQYVCGIGCYLSVRKQYAFSIPVKTIFIYIITAVFLFLLFSLLKIAIPYVWIILAVVILLGTIVAIKQIDFLKSYFSSFIR